MTSRILINMAYAAIQCPYPLTSGRAYGTCINREPHCGCHYHMQSCYLNRAFLHAEKGVLMARGKKPSTAFQNSITFVRCELDADERKKLVTWSAKPPLDLDSMLIQVLQEGHKVSYSFNPTNDSFICSVTGKPEDCINANSCYTSHAKDPVKALWVALFKYFVVWDGKVWESVEDAEDFG